AKGPERSVLRRLVVRRRRPVAVLPHERVELFLVLGVAQAAEELLELLLLLLEAPQRLAAIFVEGAVSAGGRSEAEAAEATALHAVLHPLHLPLHPFHLVLPAIRVIPATHLSAPECEKEKGKPDRPPDQKAENGHHDPAGMPGTLQHVRTIGWWFGGAAPSIDICGVGHVRLHRHHAVVNVNNIYIGIPSRVFVKAPACRSRRIIFGTLFWLAPGTGFFIGRRPHLWRTAIGLEAETAQIDQHFGFQ